MLGFGRGSVCAIAVGAFLFSAPAHAKDSFEVLYSFIGDGGYAPYGGLTADADGNLFGTTSTTFPGCCGTAFKLAPDGTETTLHKFGQGGTDASNPWAAMVLDKAGNLFGVSHYGGINGVGAVFKIAPDGKETVLYSVAGIGHPFGRLIADRKGNLYGTTYGCAGTVFKVTPGGKESDIYAFPVDGTHGVCPFAGVTLDESGMLYGTTTAGGAGNCGVVYLLTPHGKQTVLYAFAGGSDGCSPYGDLLRDADGNLYGTTPAGGSNRCNGGCGIVFKVAPDGSETILHEFRGSRDGAFPRAGLVADKKGNLYGTASGGGEANSGCGSPGCGTVFRLTPGGSFKVLHYFTGGSDGASPWGPLLLRKGRLYGTTVSGGIVGCPGGGCGVVYRID
jgi:uncharacterized repeat protein (TIGR03803 family)